MFLVSSEKTRILAHLQGTLSDRWQSRLEQQQLSTDMLNDSLGGHEGRTGAGLGRGTGLEHRGQGIQESINHCTTFLQID